jgi:type I restriction enzyme S subunit
MAVSEEQLVAVGYVKLGAVADIVMGQSPGGEDCNRSGLGEPLLNGPTEFGPRSPTPAQWTTAPTRFAEPNDVLFCVRGSTTGRMNIADRRYCVGRGVAAIRGRSDADTQFIYHAISANLDELLAFTTGTVFPNISGADLRGFQVPWPETDDRHRIAEVLSHLDEAVAIAIRIRNLAGAAAQALVASSPEACMVRDIGKSLRTQWYPGKDQLQVVDHYSLPAFDALCEPERVQGAQIASNKLRVDQPSVLFSRLNPGTNRTWLCLPSPDVDASVCSTEYAVLVPTEISVGVLWATLSSGDLGDQLSAATTGTSASHQRVSEETVLASFVPDPRALNGDQLAEAETYVQSFLEKDQELRVLRQARNTLAPLLITGALRVGVVGNHVGVRS